MKIKIIFSLLILFAFTQVQAQSPYAKFILTKMDVCEAMPTPAFVEIVGQSPFELVYTDGSSTFTKVLDESDVITGNAYQLMLQPVSSVNYQLLSVSDQTGAVTDLIKEKSLKVDFIPLVVGDINLSNAVICSGTSLSMNVYASCGSILWEYSSNNGTSYMDIPDATGASVITNKLINTGISDITYLIRAKVVSGSLNKFSDPIPLVVKASAQGVITYPDNKAIYCYGETAKLQLTDYHGSISWQKSDLSLKFKDIGITDPTLSVTYSSGPSSMIEVYRVRLRVPGCADYFTEPVGLSFTAPDAVPTLTIVPQFKNTTVCAGNNMTAIFNTSVPYKNIQWYESVDGNTFIPIAGQNSSMLSYPSDASIPIDQKRFYKAKVTIVNCSGEVETWTDVATVNIIAQPVIGILSSNKTDVCSGETIELLLSEAKGEITWYYSGNGTNFHSIGKGTSLAFTSQQLKSFGAGSAIHYFRAEVSGTFPCVNKVSNTITVTAHDGLVQYSIEPGQLENKCNNSLLELSVLNQANAHIQWYHSNDNNSFTKIVGATTPTYSEIVTNTGTAKTSSYYKVEYTSDYCPAVSTPVKRVDIYPTLHAGIIQGPSQVCNTETFTLTLTNYSGDIISWEQQPAGSNTWMALSGQGASIVLQTNASIKYRAKVSSLGCSNTVYSEPFTVTVQTKGLSIILNTYCNKALPYQAFNATCIINGTYKEFDWQVMYPNTTEFVTVATTTTPNVQLMGFPNATAQNQTYRFRVVGKQEVCPPTVSREGSFVVFPEVNALFTPPTKACLGNSLDMNIPVPANSYDEVQVKYRNFSGNTWNVLKAKGSVYTFPAFTEGREVIVTFTSYTCSQLQTRELNFNINVTGPVSATAIIGSDKGCALNNGEHQFSIDLPQNFETYEWTVSAPQAFFVSGSSYTNVFWGGFTGTATVTCTITSGCDSKTLTKIVTVNPSPEVQFLSQLEPEYCLPIESFVEIKVFPEGGVFGGSAYVNPNVVTYPFFYASQSGGHYISYTYTDPLTQCASTIYQNTWVNPAVGISSGSSPSPDVIAGTLNTVKISTTGNEKAIVWEAKAPGTDQWITVENNEYYTINTVNWFSSLTVLAAIELDNYTYRPVLINQCDERKPFFEYTMNVLPVDNARIAWNEESGNALLSVYPNPSAKEFTLQIKGMEEVFKLTVTDMLGKVIFRQEYFNQNEINFGSELPAGTYILTISDSSHQLKELIRKED